MIKYKKNEWDAAKASGVGSGNYVVPIGGYICAIKDVKDDESKNCAVFDFDIVKGEYDHFFSKKFAEDTSPDTIVYIMQHIDTDENGKVKAKTLGKMLDQQLTVEGLFSIVLLCKADERKHYFITQSDGSNPCKSPMGMFDSLEIDNDLKMVDDTIREYYGLRKASAPKAKSTTPAKKAE